MTETNKPKKFSFLFSQLSEGNFEVVAGLALNVQTHTFSVNYCSKDTFSIRPLI
jgi:hypothetical protein